MDNPEHLKTAIRLMLRAIDDADWGVLEALLHPSVEYEVSGYLPFRGRDAVMNYYKVVRPVQKGEHIVEAMIVEEDRAACWGRFNGRKKDGEQLSLLFADILRFDNRKILKRRVYYCEPAGQAENSAPG